jgi:membrane associated rhomboid family serine protease
MNLSPMVKRLLIIQAVCTVLYLFTREVTSLQTVHLMANELLLLRPFAVIHGFVWQIFTYLFLHKDAWHLLINMLMLWMLGVQLEQRWGSRSFLRFFLISGMGAGVAVVLAGLAIPAFNAPTLGMSGALNAMLMAIVIANPDATFNFYFILPIRAKHLIWVIVLIEVLMAISGSPASFPAHMGGLLMGWLLVTGKWRPSRWAFFNRSKPGKRAKLQGRAGNLRIVRPDDDDDDDEAPRKYLN